MRRRRVGAAGPRRVEWSARVLACCVVASAGSQAPPPPCELVPEILQQQGHEGGTLHHYPSSTDPHWHFCRIDGSCAPSGTPPSKRCVIPDGDSCQVDCAAGYEDAHQFDTNRLYCRIVDAGHLPELDYDFSCTGAQSRDAPQPLWPSAPCAHASKLWPTCASLVQRAPRAATKTLPAMGSAVPALGAQVPVDKGPRMQATALCAPRGTATAAIGVRRVQWERGRWRPATAPARRAPRARPQAPQAR